MSSLGGQSLAEPVKSGGGGGSVTVGTTAGTVAAGNDSRILNALELTGANTLASFPASYSTMQRGVVITRGAYPANGVQGWNQGAQGETLSVQVHIPATDTSGSAPNSIAGYANVLSTHCGGVGVYGQGNAGANATGVWGGNFLVANYAADDVGGNTGYSTLSWGIEIDVNIAPLSGGAQPLGSAFGVAVAGASRATPTGGAHGFRVQRYSDQSLGIPWTTGFGTDDGTAVTGLYLGALKRTVNQDGTGSGLTNSASQPIVFNTIDTSGAQHQSTIYTAADGSMFVQPALAASYTVIGYGATAIKIGPLTLDLPAIAGSGAQGSGSFGLNYTDSSGTGHRASIAADNAGNVLVTTGGGLAINGNLVETAAHALATYASGTSLVAETTRAQAAEALAALKSNNLSDLSNIPSARANLGLATVAASGSYTDLGNKPTAASFGVGVYMPVRVVTSGASVTMLATDGVLKINKAAPSATAVALEANPVTGAVHTVKDGAGNAALYPITVTPASGTIDGAASLVINTNRQAVTLQYDGVGDWSVI